MTAKRSATVLVTAQRLAFGAVALVTLLVIAQPAETGALAWPARAVYWALHVGLGLLALCLAGQLLARTTPGQTLWKWALCGLIGTAMAAPGYALIESLWPLPGDADIDDALDRLALHGWPGSLAAEFLGTLPWVMCGWALINGPMWRNAAVSHTDVTDPADGATKQEPGDAVDIADIEVVPQRATSPLTDRLPSQALGEFVSISADLHYLQVVTTMGRFTVLGRLRDAVDELCDRGLQVHRSHWVADAHVTRVIRRGGTTVCLLSNGDRVPVSRRRVRAVIDRLGEGVLTPPAEAPSDR